MPINSFDNYLMSWKPIIDNTDRPIYIYLADRLEEDIRTGNLTPGTKLPPQRELADFLDINLSTVSRAFKLCEQRGLICSAVGNGTYVASDAAVNSMLFLNTNPKNMIEMGAILPNSEINGLVSDYLQTMSNEPDFYKLLQYGTIDYDDLTIKAAKKWLSYFSMSGSKSNILLTSGSQNAIFSTLASLFQTGDRIATMPVTYPGIKIAAKILGIQLVPIHTENGIITRDSLLYVYKNQGIKGLYLIPDFNNPTSEVLDVKTRKTVAAFCDEMNIPVIEDAIYTLFDPNPLPPISSYTEKQGIFISSVSKALAPGLRLAVMRAPSQYVKTIWECLYGMQISPPALMIQLFTRLIISGRFEEIRKLRMEDVEKRNQIFERYFNDYPNSGNKYSPIRWIYLPNHMDVTKFENTAQQNGIQIYSADRFTVGSTKIPNAIRVSLISAQPVERYKKGLEILKTLLGKR